MNISFHTGKSAMIAQAKALNIYGNNIANVNTVGYQTIRPSFADCIYDVEREPQPDWQTGHGTYIQKTDLMFSESHFEYTDRPQDFAIAGEGFFAVEDRWGDVNYTRDGAFGITQLDGEWYLVSSSGEFVLDYEKNRIIVPFEEISKGDVRGRIDWEAVGEQIGAFTLNDVDNQRVRYIYNGAGTVEGEPDEEGNPTEVPDPAPVEDAGLQMTGSDAEAPSSAVVTTANGYFAVMDDYGNVKYTHDGQLSIQRYQGKWYLGSSEGELILDNDLNPIPVTFRAPTIEDVGEDVIDGQVQRDENDQVAVRDLETGEIVFKAVNNFEVQQDGKKFYVVSPDGEYVLDSSNRRIEVPSRDGDYYSVNWDDLVTPAGEDEEERQIIGVFQFANPTDLSTDDRTRYEGTGVADGNIEKIVEGSGVRLGDADAFFAVEGADGTVRYTRNAHFDVLQGEDGAWYLATNEGEYILGADNQRIMVAEAEQYTPNVDWAELTEMVGVFEFPNPYGIEAWGTNRYVETDRSGAAVAARELRNVDGEDVWVPTMDKLTGTLIVSNVDLATQMVKLIETQRAYQISSRVVTTSDELARIANNLR
ncbi:MAG: flagellar hook-basal body complex protein [Ruminococcaceae bacterium]|nr:flagellar hook-basal body complex protein [Oscillospiraceae bacterium]